MQIGDRYVSKKDPRFHYKITKYEIIATHGGGPTTEIVTFDYWDERLPNQVNSHRDSKDMFLKHCIPNPNATPHPMNVMGLGGSQLDALAASMRAQFNGAIAKSDKRFNLPDIDLDDKPKCDCGGKACGFKDYTRQHSSWCRVYKGD